MDVIYYYCFLFYTKIIKDDEPFATTVWVLGFLEGYFISVICDIISIRYFCFNMMEYSMFPIIGLTLIVNYLYFYKSKRAQKIIKEKPAFFGNQKISIVLTVIFFVILISPMFWGAIYSKSLLMIYCK